MFNTLKEKIGSYLAAYLEQPLKHYEPFSVHDISALRKTLQPGDILLVEGNTRVSAAIKYLTQSTWSHSAIYVGDIEGHKSPHGETCCLVEAELSKGVIASPISRYEQFNTRICRAVGLRDEDREALVAYLISRIGHRYDLKNLTDMLRYLIRRPPVPTSVRRRLLSIGSSDPTRALCSTMIAQGYQSIHYPILPRIEKRSPDKRHLRQEREIYHIRHHSLFAPRDFDLSPYFRIVKPTIEAHFDYKQLNWSARKDSASQ